MVRLQLLTGARPGEICAMRPTNVTRGIDGVWTYRPASHKTEHHGRERRIFIGPQAQEILTPYLCETPTRIASVQEIRNRGGVRSRKPADGCATDSRRTPTTDLSNARAKS
jgi:integrase